MERPNKKDYDFNDPIDCVRFAKDMINYADYIENKELKKQQTIDAIKALTEVVKSNNKFFGSEKTMEVANIKIKELIHQL